MAELATPPSYVPQVANLGSLITPNFKVPEFHPIVPNAPPVIPFGQIGAAIGAGIAAHQERQDTAAARLAGQTVDRQFLQSQGVDTSSLPDTGNSQPGPLSRLADTIGHTFDGTLGQHANDPKPASAFANLSPVDSSRGAFSVGPNGATFTPFRRDPTLEAVDTERLRGIKLANDAIEAQNRAAAAPMQGEVNPLTGEVIGSGTRTPAAPTGTSNDLPAGDGAANPAALTTPGGNAAPAPTGTATFRTTSYDSTKAADPQVDPDTAAGRTATGTGNLFRASPAIAGTIAVDPAKYAYGTIFKNPQDGKVYVAGDTGGAVKAQTASGGKADVLDIYGGQGQPDYQQMQVIPPLGKYAGLSAADKELYHRQAAVTYSGQGATPPAPAAPVATNSTPPATDGPTPAAPFAGLSLGNVTPTGAPSLPLGLPPLSTLAAGTPAPLTLAAPAPVTSQTLAALPPLPAAADVDPGPAVGAPIPVRRALPVEASPAAPLATGPYGGVLQPNGDEITAAGRILNPLTNGVRTVRRVPLTGGGVSLVDDPLGKFTAPYVVPLTPTLKPEEVVKMRAAAATAGVTDDQYTDASGNVDPVRLYNSIALANQQEAKAKAEADPTRLTVAQRETNLLQQRYQTNKPIQGYLSVVGNVQSIKDNLAIPKDKRTAADDDALTKAVAGVEQPGKQPTVEDFKAIKETAGPLDRLGLSLTGIVNTRRLLTNQQVNDFGNVALRKAEGLRQLFDGEMNQLHGQAKKAGLNPDDVFDAEARKYYQGIGTPAAPAAPAATPAPAATAQPAMVRMRAPSGRLVDFPPDNVNMAKTAGFVPVN